jgi:hypothetical protein
MADTNLSIVALHRLIGRCQSHQEDLAGRHEVPPSIVVDFHALIDVADELSQFLEALANKFPPPDWPEPSRASHRS